MYLNDIETERLRFRKLQKSDVNTWEKFFENNPNLEFLGLDLSLDKNAQSMDWIERQLLRYNENRFGHYALISKEKGVFIGQCGMLKQEIEGETEIEIAYHLLPEHWGNGYATEAAKKIRDYAIEHKICESLISIIDVRNMRSQRVAKKLGMKAGKRMQLFGLEVILFRMNI